MSFNIICSILICIIFIIVNFYNKPLNKEKQNITILQGRTMGTYWQVKIPNLKNKIYIKDLIQKYLDRDEKMLSSWKKNSIVCQFNKKKKNQPQKINKDFFKVISTALKINKKTNGKLDVTISPLIDIWGFGTKEKPINYPSQKKIKEKMYFSGSQHLKLITNSFGMFLEKDMDGIEINLSTLGEGFSVDHISYILKKKNKKLYYFSWGCCIS